jgi:hypothetical protein
VEAAGTIGNTAVRAVKDILVGIVGGVKEVASTALPKSHGETTSEPENVQPSAISMQPGKEER